MVVALALLPYVSAVTNGFVLDDVAIVAENPAIRDLGNLGQMLRSDYWGTTGRATAIIDPGLYRPLTLFTYAIDYRSWRLDPAGYHLVNIVLHAVVSLVVLMLFVEVLGAVIPAVVGAAIFAVHPIHTEAVTGIVGRAEILATLFFVLAFRRARLSAPLTQGSDASRRTMSAVGAASLFYFLGLLSKESAVTLPAVLLVDDWLRRTEIRSSAQRVMRSVVTRYVALGAVMAIYLALRQQVVTGHAQMWAGWVGVSPGFRVLTAIRVLAEYLSLFAFPRTLLADYWKTDVPVATSLLEPATLFALVLWVALAGVTWWKLRDQRPILLGAGWFLITILPASNLLFASGIGKAERILYLPSIGLCLIVGWIALRLHGVARYRRALPVAAALIVVALAARTYRRNMDWHDNLTLARATLAVSPRSPLMNTIAAEALVKSGDPRAAVPLLEVALRETPNVPGLHTHLGAAYFAQGQLERSIDEYRLALRVNPVDADALNNLAIAFLDLRQNDSAIVALNAFLRLKQNDARAENNLGVAYLRLGDRDRAAEHFRRAIEIQPDYTPARLNLDRLSADRPTPQKR
jgi:tetratricopeptide (TPR) repeat protein